MNELELKFLVKALVDKQYLEERISKLEKILKDIETVPPIDCIQDPLETLKRIINYAKVDPYAKKASYEDITQDSSQVRCPLCPSCGKKYC